MKAALYVRVSSDMQIDNFSISAQINELNKYCAKEGFEVFKVYADEGISGTLEARPQFQLMLSDAEKKCFDVILVHKYDRFARNVELSQKVKKQLKKANIGLISITEPLEDSPMGFFVGGLHELMAEYYSKNLSRESKKGHVERASQGFHNGSVPFGYRIDKNSNNMIIVPEQAGIVKRIFDMYVYQGFGSTKIAKILNWSETISPVKNVWSHYTVSRILKNVKYIGKIEYDGKIYEGKHEPIIDKDIFETTQRYMIDRTWKREYRGYYFDKFLFSGLIRCGYCKHVFRIQPSHFSKKRPEIRRFYYKCNAASHTDKNTCTFRKNFPVKELEENILDGIKAYMQGMNSNYIIHRHDIISDALDSRIDKLNIEVARAKQAYLSGDFSLEEYAEVKNKARKEIKEIQDIPKSEGIDNQMRKKIERLWDEFENADTIAEKKAILKNFIECVYVYKDRIEPIFFI